ncbi:unknown [Clostridium sp. CAG:354]|nr:unknown [Clostridium sp. CAG:354]
MLEFLTTIFNVILKLKILEAIIPLVLLMFIVWLLGGNRNIILGLLFNTIFGFVFLILLKLIGFITIITSIDVIVVSVGGIIGIIYILVKSIIF